MDIVTDPASGRKIVLSLLAHPDDAEILCGGTLVRLSQAGWKVHIATVTPGDCGTMTEDRWQIAARRTAEARAAAAVIGATYHCLDERDALVVYDKPTIAKAIDLMRRLHPALVITHAPHDYMIDHEQTSLLARGASFVYGAPNASATVPRPEGAAIPHLYYCDPIEGVDSLGQPVTPGTYVDISAAIETKAHMLAAHASQREWLRAHHGMDEYIDAMKRHGAHRGRQAGFAFAEGFVQHRGHPYPAGDLLAQLFGTQSTGTQS